jgi:Lon protease-like protein
LLLPTLDLGIHVFEQRYRELVAHSLSNGHTFGVVLIEHGEEVSGPATTHDVGTLAQVMGYAKLPDGRYLLEVEGTKRFRITRSRRGGPFPAADVTFLPDPIGNFGGAKAASVEVTSLFHLYRWTTGDGDLPVHLPADPVARSYVIASLLRIEPSEKQLLLELETAEERLEAEQAILQREITALESMRART